MRIRKNAKVSPVLMMYSGSSSSSHASAPEGVLQTHVCQLNQSPWDVIPFSQYSLALTDQGEDFNSCFTGNNNGSCLGDSIVAVESVAWMMNAGEDNKPVMNKVENNNEAKIIVDEKCDKINDNISKNDTKKKAARVSNDSGLARGNNLVMGLCQKNDGKGWQCKRDAKEGYNFCEHHLSLFRSYNNNTSATTNNNTEVNTIASKQKPTAPTLRRTRGTAATKRSNSARSNPYEFYYYSGFGPLWGRKRGERGDPGGCSSGGDDGKAEIRAAVENSNSSERSTPPSSSTTTSQIHNNLGFDYVEDEDEDRDEEDAVVSGDSGKKRMRKPVKARSLKSLM